jgi:hypothetical protein
MSRGGKVKAGAAGGESPIPGAKRRGRSVAKVCTSEARKTGETGCGAGVQRRGALTAPGAKPLSENPGCASRGMIGTGRGRKEKPGRNSHSPESGGGVRLDSGAKRLRPTVLGRLNAFEKESGRPELSPIAAFLGLPSLFCLYVVDPK